MTATMFKITKDYDNLLRLQLLSNRSFNLIIFPTEQCNFRCVYCYEDFISGRMKKETIIGIKLLLEKRCNNLDNLNISWFGGEPLTARDIVLEIAEYATAQARKYPTLCYKGDMTTNGYFLDYSTFIALANVGVRDYQISLDGPREIHNKSRIRANGDGTYDQIWANLLAIRNSSVPVSVLLRIHFTVDTLQHIDPLLEDIKKEFLSDPRFSIFFKAIERLGGANNASIKIFSEAKKKAAINLLQKKLFGENIEISQNYEITDKFICYASQPNSLIIRANGDVGKCTVALNDERNKIGTLQSDGTLKIIPGRISPWIRGIETLDPATLGCPLINLPSNNEFAST